MFLEGIHHYVYITICFKTREVGKVAIRVQIHCFVVYLSRYKGCTHEELLSMASMLVMLFIKYSGDISIKLALCFFFVVGAHINQ